MFYKEIVTHSLIIQKLLQKHAFFRVFVCLFVLLAGRLGVTVCHHWTLSLPSCLGQDNNFSLLHRLFFSVFLSFVLHAILSYIICIITDTVYGWSVCKVLVSARTTHRFIDIDIDICVYIYIHI